MVEIVLNSPGKNALGLAVMESLLARLEEAQGEPVLLTGAGGAFSAGLNLKELQALDGPGMEAFLGVLEDLVSTLYTYPAPTVAAVNGHAIAGGCVLAVACDHRVGAVDAGLRMGLNEVALGLQFPPGILRMLQQRLPPEHLSEALLGAAVHPPQDSLRLGFLDELAEDPVAVGRARLEALSRHPRAAYAATKRALRGTSTARAGDRDELRWLVPSWTSPELKARIAAVLKK